MEEEGELTRVEEAEEEEEEDIVVSLVMVERTSRSSCVRKELLVMRTCWPEYVDPLYLRIYAFARRYSSRSSGACKSFSSTQLSSDAA